MSIIQSELPPTQDRTTTVTQKREVFQNSIRKQQREQIFKKKRTITNSEMLPFSMGEKGGICVHYELANEAQIPTEYYFEPPTTWEERAYQVQLLFRYLEHKDPDDDLAENTLKMVVDMLGQGFPLLDKSCLVIIKLFTNLDHNINRLILNHIGLLIEFNNKCGYQELRHIILEIFYNLALDCDICRNTLIAYDIPYALNQWEQSSQDEIVELVMAMFERDPTVTGQFSYYFKKAVNQLFDLVSDENRIKFIPFFKQLYQYDPSCIQMQVIDWLCRIQQIPEDYILDVVLIFSKISNLDHHPQSLEVIDQVIQIGYINQTLRRRRVASNVYLTLYNFALDGKINCSQILKKDFIRCVHKSREYFEMLIRLIQCCSEDELEQVNPEGQIIICVTNLLQDEEVSFALQLLDLLESVLIRQPHYLQLFQEQNGQQILNGWFRHEDDQIADACERVFKLID